ncbi:hypothetical protein [Herbidospora sp. NBRC 101105]|uniref:hypothetical protein n=1 Tax=Herbidospora sp. NBRC 101105 TaxID=3032195 RepID=UPI0024A0B371|nr:hypothetical protein [Herbidospora sp. NBRC 101105]GLX95788.1 hypothetical protein Hesp01_37380 [Herbidospora sp. NBRC 101105]
MLPRPPRRGGGRDKAGRSVLLAEVVRQFRAVATRYDIFLGTVTITALLTWLRT